MYFPRVSEFLASIRSHAIDAAIVATEHRRKRLLVADMDSTMIEQECIDELGVVAGVGERIKHITARAMRGELDFDAALRERVALLKGLPVSVIDDLLASRITLMPGGKNPARHHEGGRRLCGAHLRRLHRLHRPCGESAGL